MTNIFSTKDKSFQLVPKKLPHYCFIILMLCCIINMTQNMTFSGLKIYVVVGGDDASPEVSTLTWLRMSSAYCSQSTTPLSAPFVKFCVPCKAYFEFGSLNKICLSDMHDKTAASHFFKLNTNETQTSADIMLKCFTHSKGPVQLQQDRPEEKKPNFRSERV